MRTEVCALDRFSMISHISLNKIIDLTFFTSGDQSYEKETLICLLLVSVGTSVQIFSLGLAILLIFGQTFGQI